MENLNHFLVDTHAHLYVKQFQNDLETVLERANTEGVKKIYLPAIDAETHEAMLALEAAHPTVCTAMMGVHPCSINAETIDNELVIAKKYLSEHSFCAVGEIGIDLFWDKTTLDYQKKAFVEQMHWAQDVGLPVVIHSRDSTDVIIEILAENRWFTEGGIFHCFTGNLEQAQRVIDLGFYLGIGGVSTYKNGGLEPVLSAISLDYLVLETDAPYLAPVPHRGKRNESAYIKHVAEKIAAVKLIDFQSVASATSANAEKIFQKRIR